MVSKNAMIGIVAVLAIIGIAAVFMAQTPAPQQAIQPQPGPAPAPAGVRQIEIVMVEERGGRKWVPSTVTVKLGEEIELTVENDDDETDHQLVIPAFNVDTGKIAPGKEVTVKFKADKTGRFEFSDPLQDEMVGDEDVRHSQEKGILIVEA